MNDNSDVLNHFSMLIENGWEVDEIRHLMGAEDFSIVLEELELIENEST